MALRLPDDKIPVDKIPEKEPVKEIFITFTDLYAKKQSWLEEKLTEGYRVFLNPKQGRAMEIKLVTYH